MHHEIAEVEQGPETFIGAFDAKRLHASLFNLGLFNSIEHGGNLAVVLRGHDNEEIGHAHEFTNVLNHDVGSLLGIGRLRSDHHFFKGGKSFVFCHSAYPF